MDSDSHQSAPTPNPAPLSFLHSRGNTGRWWVRSNYCIAVGGKPVGCEG